MHDLVQIDYILPEVPIEISATGIGHVNGAGEDTASFKVLYSGSLSPI